MESFVGLHRLWRYICHGTSASLVVQIDWMQCQLVDYCYSLYCDGCILFVFLNCSVNGNNTRAQNPSIFSSLSLIILLQILVDCSPFLFPFKVKIIEFYKFSLLLLSVSFVIRCCGHKILFLSFFSSFSLSILLILLLDCCYFLFFF